MPDELAVIKKIEKLIAKKLIQLEKIDFSAPEIGYTLNENKNIVGLSLYYTKISDISFVKNFKDLRDLDLTKNRISDISSVKDLLTLKNLHISSNQISNASGLKNLKNLTELDLRYNKISDISFVKDLMNLKRLNLSENQISNVSGLKKLKNLTHLDLRYIQISNYSFVKDLKNLTNLDLSDNQINDISFVKDLKKLTALRLRSNQISDISSVKDLNNLTNLDLGINQISDISSVKDLKKLTLLDLSVNEIKKIPFEIINLKLEFKWVESSDFSFNSKGLNLYHNPLESPPIEIIKKGKQKVIEYFKSLEGEKQGLNEVKVLLVGDGGAGKTSLMKQLCGENFNSKESQTHGINIKDWDIKTNDTPIQVHFWDFGGQEIMHATHQFFLSKRSLYILVLDGRKEEDAEYWLKHIQSFGGDSPVLILLNKIDENPGFDVNRKFLQQKYNSIKGFFRISCKSGEGTEEFKNHLFGELPKVEHIKTLWAKSWFNVKKQLQQMEKDYISYNEYENICDQEKITTEESQDTLIDFLNDLGIVVHFNEAILRETNVINPIWLTEAVYKIINSKELADNKGILKTSSLKTILDNVKYPAKKHDYIIELMKKFELCYSINENTILVPDLLKVDEPDFEFDFDSALKFIFAYDFLPKSIIAKFIVKRHQEIKGDLRWRTGVVLEDKAYFNTSAVVRVDEREKKIFIFVSGDQKRDCFSVLRKTFREINESFEKLVVKELVPLPGSDNICVEYDELVGYELMGKDEYIVGKLRKAYSVSELLSGIEKKEERIERLDKEEKINIHIHDLVKDSGKAVVDINQNVEINLDLKIELPKIQSEFDEFKKLLLKALPEYKNELEEIGKELDSVTTASDKKEINNAFNKAGRFFKQLGNEDSELSQKLQGVKKGAEYVKKGFNLLKKIAPFLGWAIAGL